MLKTFADGSREAQIKNKSFVLFPQTMITVILALFFGVVSDLSFAQHENCQHQIPSKYIQTQKGFAHISHNRHTKNVSFSPMFQLSEHAPRPHKFRLQLIPSTSHPSSFNSPKSKPNRSNTIGLASQELSLSPNQKSIFDILNKHYESKVTDPEGMHKVLIDLAVYYSTYPKTNSLIKNMGEKNWILKYSQKGFRTEFVGDLFGVNDVVIYFNPSSAAKLKFYSSCSKKKAFCVASPADALLHELLHTESILSDFESFIVDGGLNPNVYPIKHERRTIKKENKIYHSMTQQDEHPRPIRFEHRGSHTYASCVTCIE